jgi:prepilin-type N-terminal cleavage/methylation domain-containing protein
MKPNRRAFTLLEMLVAMAISAIVLMAGYRAYFLAMQTQDVETARESATFTITTAMNSIKHDVRSASSVSVSPGSLTIAGREGRIVYKCMPGIGLEKTVGQGRHIYKGLTARFSRGESGRGVNVELKWDSRVHKRPVRMEVTSYVIPRN